MSKPFQILTGAGGECIETLEASIKISLGKFTKQITYKVAVIKGLIEPILVGLDLMEAMDLVLHIAKRRVSFEPNSLKPGVWLRDEEVIAPRSEKIAGLQGRKAKASLLNAFLYNY